MDTIRAADRKRGFSEFRPVSMLAELLLVWCQRRRQRLHLSRLSRDGLEDIGLSAEKAAVEARKPFWQR